MDTKNSSQRANSKPERDKGDKIEVVKILLLMVFSFLLGFALVIIFLKPTGTDSGNSAVASELSERNSGTPVPPPEQNNGKYAPPDPTKTPVSPPPASENSESEAPNRPVIDQATAPPTVPPGRTPQGVSLDGNGFYIKCWDGDGRERPGNACDRLKTLEKRLSTRLYIIDECRKSALGDDTVGKLSLGVEVDFSSMSLSYWTGPSSDIPNARKIASCLRSKLAGLPIGGLDHNYQRYRIFFTVLFEDPQKKKTLKPGREISVKKGTKRQVIKDRVRVRKEPVDGEIIGKISSGNEVQVISKKANWCQVITPNNNHGWMICDALSK